MKARVVAQPKAAFAQYLEDLRREELDDGTAARSAAVATKE